MNPLLIIVQINSIVALCHPKLCVNHESCQVREVFGHWCDWSPWSACELQTCSRTRFRECSCPKPTGFKQNLLCDTLRYQNDIIEGRNIIKHTRLIRKTSLAGVNCKIPFYYNNQYFPDCMKSGLDHICQTATGQMVKCLMDETSDMIEEDMGDCEGWKSFPHLSVAFSRKVSKSLFDSKSDLGQKCEKRSPVDSETNCRLNLYFGPNQRSDFGKLIDFAYNLIACRLACSIHPECRSIDFYEGYRCALNMVDNVVVEQQIGNKHEIKPQICIIEQRKVDKSNYNFSNIVQILDARRYGG